MRHGPAEEQAPSGRDYDRQLTPSGRKRTERVARELGAMEEIPRRVLTSPLCRTVQTAEVVIATLNLPLEFELCDDLAPGGNSFALARRLASEGSKRVMLIGHEPDLSIFTAHLLPEWTRGFEKSMVVGLSVDRQACVTGARSNELARSRFVIEPKRLDN